MNAKVSSYSVKQTPAPPKKSKKKFLIAAGVVAALVLVGGLVFGLNRDDPKPTATNDLPTAVTEETINYDPPTEEEKQSADSIKENAPSTTTPPPTPPAGDGTKAVTPKMIVDSPTSLAVTITNIAEDGGSCTFTASNGTDTKTFTAEAANAGSYTVCRWDSHGIAADGTYTARVAYKSNTSSGTSEALTIQ